MCGCACGCMVQVFKSKQKQKHRFCNYKGPRTEEEREEIGAHTLPNIKTKNNLRQCGIGTRTNKQTSEAKSRNTIELTLIYEKQKYLGKKSMQKYFTQNFNIFSGQSYQLQQQINFGYIFFRLYKITFKLISRPSINSFSLTSPKAPRPITFNISKSSLCNRICFTLEVNGLAETKEQD